jgi:hypothetical protein
MHTIATMSASDSTAPYSVTDPISAEIHSEIELAVNAALAGDLADVRAAERAISATGQHYIASVLAALAAWTRVDCDDPIGAAMLERFAREFARHEATVV